MSCHSYSIVRNYQSRSMEKYKLDHFTKQIAFITSKLYFSRYYFLPLSKNVIKID